MLLAAVLLSMTIRWITVRAQPHDPPDRTEPGDEAIQAYLKAETQRIEGSFLDGLATQEAWEKRRPQYLQEYFYMLGLWPLPERTPLAATVTGRLEGVGYTVEMLHYQSRPGLYVTGNLYRPAEATQGARLPAVLYVCGHASRGRNGNKTAYQSHGIWFARHGYVCLTVDTVQLGEIAGVHHGTYREGRWWWWSRGYTPAGGECWNGVRGIDYLLSRPDVDADRIAVTGISGGGAATFWIAAADDRVRVAVPVSGMADLASYVPNRVVNGHCDCMFLYNTYEWPWTRIAALIAPRPLLFANSDQDDIFPMDANDRVINRLKRFYDLFGASDRVESLVSVGGHAYRKDLRESMYRFLNAYLKNDPRQVADSEVDLVVNESDTVQRHPIDPARLRVFPTDGDFPKDEINTRIDQLFVPMATVPVPQHGDYDSWRKALLDELRRVAFRRFPVRIPPARAIPQASDSGRLETEPGIEIGLSKLASPASQAEIKGAVLVVSTGQTAEDEKLWTSNAQLTASVVYRCTPRGIGETRWTRKNPPNYVERSLALLGQTVDAGRVWDVIASVAYLRHEFGPDVPITVAGTGSAAVLAAYAAVLEPEVAEISVQNPVPTHMEPAAPQFLNVLRVCDVPDILGMLAPRPLRIQSGQAGLVKKVSEIYSVANASVHLTTR